MATCSTLPETPTTSCLKPDEIREAVGLQFDTLPSGRERNGHFLAKNLVLSYTMSRYVTRCHTKNRKLRVSTAKNFIFPDQDITAYYNTYSASFCSCRPQQHRSKQNNTACYDENQQQTKRQMRTVPQSVCTIASRLPTSF